MYKKLLIFFENIIRKFFKTSIFTVFLFTYSPLYLLHILFNIVGFYSKVENSVISSFSKSIVSTLLFLSLFLFLVLNISITKEKIERLVGSTFLETYSPGEGKTLLSLFLFLITFSALGSLEASSVVRRMKAYSVLTDSIDEEFDKIVPGEPVEAVCRSINKILLIVRDLPSEQIPNTGIITDIANFFSFF